MIQRRAVFRGQQVENGEWAFGDLVYVRDGDAGNLIPNIVISYNHDTFDWIEVIPETIGQFTGVYDNVGKLIFEGDLLSDPLYDDEGNVLPDSQSVIYCNIKGAWCVDVSFKKDGSCLESFIEYLGVENLLVVGNIYDNPELI